MSRKLTEDQVRLLRTRAQQLAEPAAGAGAPIAQVVARLVGVQAQDVNAAGLALRARCAGVTLADVERARVADRTIVRTWAMRGTLHHVPAADLGWLLGLLGPVFIRAGRGRRAQLGLDEASGEQAVAALCAVLAEHGPLTRDEIVQQLAGRGVDLAGQARPHLLQLATLQGLICHGPMRGRQPTYVLIADWIDPGPALPSEQARAELARRYLAAFAPATPEDMATWSGLSLTEARVGWQQIAGQLLEVQVGQARAWMLEAHEAWLDAPDMQRPVVRLLPNFDNYLLGYRDRSLILTGEQARRVNSGGGMLHPLLLIDGRGAGLWKVERHRGGIDVIVEPFEQLEPDVQPGLAAEVASVTRFLTG